MTSWNPLSYNGSSLLRTVWVESIVQSIAKKILTKGTISNVTSPLVSQKSIFFIAPVIKCYLLVSAEQLRMSHMNIDS